MNTKDIYDRLGQAPIAPQPSYSLGDRRDTKVNDDGVMDFLIEDSKEQIQQQRGRSPQYPQPTDNFGDVDGYGSWATVGNEYDAGFAEEEMERSAGMNYPYPDNDVAQNIINRQPRGKSQPQRPTGFKTSEELYRQFKMFILGPVEGDPYFNFEELMDVIDDMKDMTELVFQQRTRKRKNSTKPAVVNNKYLDGVDDDVYDELDDIDYDF